jgi:hypothetical protein
MLQGGDAAFQSANVAVQFVLGHGQIDHAASSS